MDSNKEGSIQSGGNWRIFIRENILEGENVSSKIFDWLLIIIIVASIVIPVLDTIPSVKAANGKLFWNLEILFTVIFTIEYILRVICAKKPASYIFSIMGIIDLISLSPLYLTLLFRGKEIFNLVRMLRLLRIFSRLIKMSKKIGNNSYFMHRMIDHLGTNEKIVYYFKSSRRKFLFGYLLAYFLMIVSFSEILFDYFSSSVSFNPVFLKFAGYTILALALILLLRYEIKILSVRYALTTQRVLRSAGIIHEDFKSTNFSYIADTLLYQSFWHKILVIGDVKIKTTGNDYENLNLDDISNPMKIKKIIHDNITKIHDIRNQPYHNIIGRGA